MQTAKLVSLPFADLGCLDVTDIVHVEQEQGAAFRRLEGVSRSLQSIATQAIELHAALKVDVYVTGSGNRAVPFPVRIRIFGAKEVGRRRSIQNHLK
jgi:hypothetical protein